MSIRQLVFEGKRQIEVRKSQTLARIKEEQVKMESVLDKFDTIKRRPLLFEPKVEVKREES